MATDMWISDQAGHIGLFDVNTGALVPGTYHVAREAGAAKGLALTDIAFIGDTMYGTTYHGLYAIDPHNGDAAEVGNPYTVTSGMNALVGHNDTLYGASYTSDEIYTINGATAKQADYKDAGYASAGDLAWVGKVLYESVRGPSGDDGLLNLNTGSGFYFHTTSGVETNDLFGLAYSGSAMYAVADHDIYKVNMSDGLLTYLSSDAASGIGKASGAAFAGIG